MFGTVERLLLLPRPLNPKYVGYTSVLERLTSCLLWQDDTTSGRRQIVCVLSGMGDVGKSETILQFLEKNDGAICERYCCCLSSDSSGQALIDNQILHGLLGGLR
jgi:hypothetical protein